MAHVRASIREFVREALRTIPGLEASVEIDSEKIPESLELPWVHVLLGNETILQLGLGSRQGRKNSRELELMVDVYCRGVTESLLIAEAYAAEVETKLATDPRMGGLTQNISLRGYAIERDAEGSPPITRIRMQWSVTYFTNERDATVPA